MPTDKKSRVRKIVGIDRNTTPEDLGINYQTGFQVSTVPSVSSRTIPAYGYFDNEGFFHTPDDVVTLNPLPNNQELEVVTRHIPKQNNKLYDNKLYDRYVGSYYRNQDQNQRDLNIANQYLQSPHPIDIIKGLYYTARADRPESVQEANQLTVNLPVDISRKGIAKAIFARAMREGKDVSKIFQYMPKAAQQEVLADNTFRKALEYKGLTKATQKGERVFYVEGPSISGSPKQKRYQPMDIEDAQTVSDSEDLANRIMQQNRRNRVRGITEQELPVSTQPEMPTSNGLQRPVQKSNTERVADILEEKSIEGSPSVVNETLEQATQPNPYWSLKDKATIKWRSYDDDKALVDEYKKMAQKGEVDRNPEFDALAEELRTRNLIDDDGRIISKPKEPVSNTAEQSSQNQTTYPNTWFDKIVYQRKNPSTPEGKRIRNNVLKLTGWGTAATAIGLGINELSKSELERQIDEETQDLETYEKAATDLETLNSLRNRKKQARSRYEQTKDRARNITNAPSNNQPEVGDSIDYVTDPNQYNTNNNVQVTNISGFMKRYREAQSKK